MEIEAKKPKLFVEKIEILDESTGQMILKEQTRLVYSKIDSENDNDTLNRGVIMIEDYDDVDQDDSEITELELVKKKENNNNNSSPHYHMMDKSTFDCDIGYSSENNESSLIEKSNSLKNNLTESSFPKKHFEANVASNSQRVIIIEATTNSTNQSENFIHHTNAYEIQQQQHQQMSRNHHHHQQQETGPIYQTLDTATLTKKSLLSSGFSSHIIQNYSILAQEISAPLETPKSIQHSSQHIAILSTSADSSSCDQLTTSPSSKRPYQTIRSSKATRRVRDIKENQNSLVLNSSLDTDDLENGSNNEANCCSDSKTSSSLSNSSGSNVVKSSAQKDLATCQFCGRCMLKKNIPTHIRRAHTPKEELVCLNEEQNIFTLHHLKPGQRRKRSARAYDYSLMTATVNIDDDPTEGIENKFITEGEEILSTDLLQLADRIKYGVCQIPISTLTKLIEILTKIEYSTQDEVSANAKMIRNLIYYYLASGEEFKYKIKQVADNILDKKKQVYNLRADLKEIMARKAQLERKIQPLVCDLQRLEDQHGMLIESIMKESDLLQFEILTNESAESATI